MIFAHVVFVVCMLLLCQVSGGVLLVLCCCYCCCGIAKQLCNEFINQNFLSSARLGLAWTKRRRAALDCPLPVASLFSPPQIVSSESSHILFIDSNYVSTSSIAQVVYINFSFVWCAFISANFLLKKPNHSSKGFGRSPDGQMEN